MPRYFFHISILGQSQPDEIGDDLPSPDDAQREAFALAVDLFPKLAQRSSGGTLSIEVSDGDSQVMKVSLDLKLSIRNEFHNILVDQSSMASG